MLRESLIAFLPMLACSAASFAQTPSTLPVGASTRPAAVADSAADARGLDQALERLHAPMRSTDPLSPEQELAKFKLRDGLAIDLVAAEPDIRQPLCINFDERGRMWVVQYIQYPFPAGLKVVEYDQYIRAKFDKVPAAPPNHVKGHDRITILEDVDGKGHFTRAKTFVDGLNIATSALPGRGGRGPDDYGVWVMNAPYLLFYPDKNRRDLPDGDPIVHLSGFGLEDTHAVASNLTWGPDGWLYGTQGSTCTAKVKAELSGSSQTTDFLGQAIWRYHPETHRFEIFAEGGGNTFGLEFDDVGNAFSGTNWGKYRGLHFAQGGYYIKGWGKHGPLTNPYAFGFFDHMPHEGNADRLSHTYIVYGGVTLGPEYTGKIISPNPLQSRIQITRLERDGSTFKTVEEPYMATCDDGWFRPVDLKAGPDGTLYIADFYERRISHVDPRDTWDRSNGRIWRIRPKDDQPGVAALDMAKDSADILAQRLTSKNRWERNTARQMLALHPDPSIAPKLRQMLQQPTDPAALEALLALHVIGSLDDATHAAAIAHPSPAVRDWAIRLAGDTKNAPISATVQSQLIAAAEKEPSPMVRSQLASTARRLPAEQALPIIQRLLARTEDAKDPHIPLLLWWAVEDKTISNRAEVVKAFSTSQSWNNATTREVIFPRLAKRYAAEPTLGNQQALAQLLKAAPGEAERAILFKGIKEGLSSASIADFSPDLMAALRLSPDPEIALRLGDAGALDAAWKIVEDEKNDPAERARLVELIGNLARPESAPRLLHLIDHSKKAPVRKAAIAALGRFNDPALGGQLAVLYPALPTKTDLRPTAISTLLSRSPWTAALLGEVSAGHIARGEIGITQLQQIRQFNDPTIAALADKLFGKQSKPTSEEKSKEIARIMQIASTGAGQLSAGHDLFTQRCAVCHTLHGQGAKVGPELTSYDRRNIDFLATSIVDPSAYIREEFTAFRIRTKAGETLIGLITDRTGNQITLTDAAQQKTLIPRAQIIEERAMTTSLMPEGLLEGLTDQQVRDLFKFLSSDKPPTHKP